VDSGCIGLGHGTLFSNGILYYNISPCNHDCANRCIYSGDGTDVICGCGGPQSSRRFNRWFCPAVYSDRTQCARTGQQH
jgi:hypothetical protein